VSPTVETLVDLVASASARGGDRMFLQAPDVSVRYADLANVVSRVAGGLDDVDPRADAPLAIACENSGHAVIAWWAQAWRGGVSALVHAAYRGEPLSHALQLVQARVVLVDAAMLARLVEVLDGCPRVQTVILLGDAADVTVPDTIDIVPWNRLVADPRVPADVMPGDACTIMFTSGTTGPAKGVVKSHRFETTYGRWAAEGVELRPHHTMWSCSPLAHARTANATVIAAAHVGAGVVLGRRYRAESFWRDATDAGATHVLISSSLANRLAALDPSDDDRDHTIEVVHCLPGPSDPAGFAARFGITLTGQGYGLTEAYVAPQRLREQDWTQPASFAGRPHPAMRVVVHDVATGREVPRDGVSVGELRVRPAHPDDMFSGYCRDPEATAEAVKDGWFHTGDLFAWDEGGALYFAGRAKDTIRYRGENVSAWQVEHAALSLPGVLEAAAFAVPADLGEEDVRLDVLVSHPVSLNDLADHLTRRLPSFMVPRYLAIRSDFDRTPTGKIRKFVLAAGETDVVGEVLDRRPSPSHPDERHRARSPHEMRST
jgi:crotonobetaine/carnitine-CoA ligase